MSHTQGKKHQDNLGKRAAKEAAERAAAFPQPLLGSFAPARKAIKIGRPGYRVVKQRDPDSGARSLLFEVEYPEIEEDLQPRHRFMSAYEQRREAPDRAFQFLLFAAAPYETIAFKVWAGYLWGGKAPDVEMAAPPAPPQIPSTEIDRDPAKFYTHWDAARKVFTLQLFFKAV